MLLLLNVLETFNFLKSLFSCRGAKTSVQLVVGGPLSPSA